MRIFKIMLIAFILGGLSLPLASCASKSDPTPVSENQVVIVQRGDLTVDITAAGNLALSQTEDLAFEVAGTVEEVLVQEGDIVGEGQVLAKLDTSEWEDNLEALQDKLTTAERGLTAKERALVKARRQVTAKEFAVRQAQLDLQTVEYNASQIADVKKVQDAIDNAEYALKFAKSILAGELGGGVELSNYTYWSQLKANAEEELAEAENDLQEILDGSSISVSSDVALEVANKQLQVVQKQMGLEDAQLGVEDAKQAVEDAQLDLEDAKHDVEDAQETLDEAKSAGPVITAPFTGFITRVNVEGGDEVMKGTVAVTLADPTKFEADVMVSEMDIFQVKLGGVASVQVDAMQGMSLPAEVTHISPTATIQSGVVNYEVKVEIQSLEALMQERQQAMQGELPEQLRQAIEEGQITQEQAEEMMKQMQQRQGGQQGQTPAMISEDFQLREGLTVTVSIIVDERNDVLLVPNGAITTEGRQSYVQVLSPDGTVEERAIIIGISNWQYTEVTKGLSEGEKVVVPQGTSTTPTTQQQRPPGGMFIPGMGRH